MSISQTGLVLGPALIALQHISRLIVILRRPDQNIYRPTSSWTDESYTAKVSAEDLSSKAGLEDLENSSV